LSKKIKSVQQIGDYKLLYKLGEGGMGAVFAAENINTGQKVALKLIKTDVSSNIAIIARFRREIEVSKQFAHPFVIKILDGGVLKGKDAFYLVMELLTGESFSDFLSLNKLNTSSGARILTHMAEALSYVHAQGVVHRDIKPDNLFIVSSDRTILLDFGLALAEDRTRLSATSDRVGTWITMAPEQLLGDELDGRADIYSLGVTMYWGMTGEAPFSNDQIISIATGIDMPQPKPPIELNNELEKYLSDIVLKCISVNKEQRYSSANDLLEALKSKSAEGFTSQTNPLSEQTDVTNIHDTGVGACADTGVGTAVRRGPSLSSRDHRTVKLPKQPSAVEGRGSRRRYIFLICIFLLLAVFTGVIYSHVMSRLSGKSDHCLADIGGNGANDSGGRLSENHDNGNSLKYRNRSKQTLENKLNKMVRNYRKGAGSFDLNFFIALGKLVKVKMPIPGFSCSEDCSNEFVGKYYLSWKLAEKGQWKKVYNFYIQEINSFGPKVLFYDSGQASLFLAKAAIYTDSILDLVSFLSEKLESATTEDEIYGFKFQVAAMKNFHHNKLDEMVPHQGKNILIKDSDIKAEDMKSNSRREAYIICLQLKKEHLIQARVGRFSDLYLSILSSFNSEEAVAEGIAFVEHWINHQMLSSENKIKLLTGGVGLLFNSRKDSLWDSIPKKYFKLAVIYAKLAIKTGEGVMYKKLPFLYFKLGEVYARSGKPKKANAILAKVLTEFPEQANDYNFISTYIFVSKKNSSYEDAIQFINLVIERNKKKQFLTEKEVRELLGNQKKYRNYLLLKGIPLE